MSKERKITDSDLENVSGAGVEIKNVNINIPENPPGTGSLDDAKEPPTGGSPDGFENEAEGGDNQTPGLG